MRSGALALAACLAAALAAPPGGAVAPAPARATSVAGTAEVIGFDMTAASVGWAWGYRRGRLTIWRSTRAGAAWRRVAAPRFVLDATDPVGPSVFFLNGTEGWAAWVATRPGARASVVVARTLDRGRSWSSTAFGAPAYLAMGQVADVGFTNARDGWLVVLSQGSMGYQEKTVYRSDDGGRRWRMVSADSGYVPAPAATPDALPEEGGVRMAYESRRRAWAALDQFMAAGTYVNLFETRDGGAAWTRVGVPVPASLLGDGTRASAPVLDGARGILLVTFMRRGGGGGARVVAYGTRDGGVAWRPLAQVRGALAASAFWGTRTGLLATNPGSILWSTTDGGRTWRPLGGVDPAAARLGYAIVALQMTGRRTAWALLRPSNAAGDGGASLLLRTTDGGRTWQPPSGP